MNLKIDIRIINRLPTVTPAGYMRTHIENTSCKTGSIVACVYCGRCLEMGLLYCWLSVAGLFTESFPSNGSTRHNMVMTPHGPRNQERLCWQGPAANCPTLTAQWELSERKRSWRVLTCHLHGGTEENVRNIKIGISGDPAAI
jgi:hypothetical protein